MEVVVAKSAGFCFGVKRAVSLVYEAAKEHPGKVCTMGPIIHNEQVVDDLKRKGVHVIDDDLIRVDNGEPISKDSVIIVRSHGIPKMLMEKVKASGCKVVDATCPFVRKIHDIVKQKSQEGYHIVIIGNPNHPEVEGIRGWAMGPCTVINDAEDISEMEGSPDTPICIVSQTTFNHQKFKDLVEIIEKIRYHVVVTNTICNATRERQSEAYEIAGRADAMIVIGGRHSSNTQKLYDICKSRCDNTYYIQTLDDLVTVNFQSDSYVGITAGASTPNIILQEVFAHVRGTEL
ncbi:MAG: 4-hydroxy-3-methylbut-2-enyl diphosphate reductase [Lachnospiraceae bacterium]|nr:4-hydroxy-3-methylbut-2-enyl diphosphate reductase [Lachnospiraceae bacterium]